MSDVEEKALGRLSKFKHAVNTETVGMDDLFDYQMYLRDILKEHPEFSKEIFEVSKIMLKSKSNGWRSHAGAFETLAQIAVSDSKYVKEILGIFDSLLDSKKNSPSSIGAASESLCIMAENYPEFAEQIFACLNKSFKSTENNYWSMKFAYGALDKLTEVRPELSEKIAITLSVALNSDKNGLDHLIRDDLYRENCQKGYDILYNVLSKNNRLAEAVCRKYNFQTYKGENALNFAKTPEQTKFYLDLGIKPETLNNPLNEVLSLKQAKLLVKAGAIITEDIINKYKEQSDIYNYLKVVYEANIQEERKRQKQIEHEKYLNSPEYAKKVLFEKDDFVEQPEKSLTSLLKNYGAYINRPKEEYEWQPRQSPDEKSKLIMLINNDMNDKIEVDEKRLFDLKGVSIKDLADGYSETALLAAKAYDCSHLSGLLQVAIEAPNTLAFDLISARYREQYGNEVVNAITERADEIIKLPYKKMFFETITKDNSNAPEANFLDAFTDKIRDLAMKKYGQEDWYTSISEAAKNPEFMKECDKVWEEMFAEADKYASYKPNEHNNAYIRQMFSDKAEQLHEFVTTQKTGDFAEVLDETIKYHQKVGKMMAALREYSKDNEVSFNGNLHFDLVDAGIETKKEAKRCLDIWQSANERPDRYGSPYNEYSVRQIAQIAKSNVMQDWMYPVMMDAIEKGGLTMSEGRMPSERTLFDCCKAWKINPAMPQRLAKFVGTHSLKGRMLAGAIFDKMVTDGKTTPEEWRDNKVLHEKFYEELARAEKMPREKALKQYIPNTPVNRKRMVGMGMEEKGIENTPENFKSLYRQMREQGVFEKMLAKPEEARTTFSSRLLVETARRRAGRE